LVKDSELGFAARGAGVGVGVGVAVGTGVGVRDGVGVGLGVGAAVGLGVGVGVGVAAGVAVGIGVAVGPGVGVAVGCAVGVAVTVALDVAVGVGLGVGEPVGIGVGVFEAVGLAVGTGTTPALPPGPLQLAAANANIANTVSATALGSKRNRLRRMSIRPGKRYRPIRYTSDLIPAVELSVKTRSGDRIAPTVHEKVRCPIVIPAKIQMSGGDAHGATPYLAPDLNDIHRVSPHVRPLARGLCLSDPRIRRRTT
jgi:hypothetical protein